MAARRSVVRVNSGSTILEVPYDAAMTVRELKEIVAREQVPPTVPLNVRLFRGRTELSERSKTMADHDVTEGDTVFFNRRANTSLAKHEHDPATPALMLRDDIRIELLENRFRFFFGSHATRLDLPSYFHWSMKPAAFDPTQPPVQSMESHVSKLSHERHVLFNTPRWQPRKLVLRGNQLMYYEGVSSGETPRGCIPLTPGVEVEKVQEGAPIRRNAFLFSNHELLTEERLTDLATAPYNHVDGTDVPAHTFAVTTDRRTYYFSTESAPMCTAWVNAISTNLATFMQSLQGHVAWVQRIGEVLEGLLVDTTDFTDATYFGLVARLVYDPSARIEETSTAEQAAALEEMKSQQDSMATMIANQSELIAKQQAALEAQMAELATQKQALQTLNTPAATQDAETAAAGDSKPSAESASTPAAAPAPVPAPTGPSAAAVATSTSSATPPAPPTANP